MAATTIKVSTEVRDRLNALAAEEGLTAGRLVEKLMEEYLWKIKVETAGRQMRAMTPAERADYMAEVAEWDATLSDGLEPDDWSDEWNRS